MTVYEHVCAERLAARELWMALCQPMNEAVYFVSTTRPTARNWQCFIRLERRLIQTPAFKKPRWMVTERPTKDRGS